MSKKRLRLVIFGQGRTGSTLLESLLCSTGHFSENGELFDKDRIDKAIRMEGGNFNPLNYIQELSDEKPSKNFIFHVKIYQLYFLGSLGKIADFLNALYKNGWNFIYLKRRNKVNQVLSNLIAESRGKYHKYDDKNDLFRLVVDCNQLVRRVVNRIWHDNAEKLVLANLKFLEIVYDDDLESPDVHQATVDKVLEYLSLRHCVAATEHRKVNTQSQKELVVNYEEFARCLLKRNWQKFLDGD